MRGSFVRWRGSGSGGGGRWDEVAGICGRGQGLGLSDAIPGRVHGQGAIRRVGWCSGGAEGYIEQAAALGLDAYISGEIAEPTVHIARELGIHYIAAGHHATERYGVQALGRHLAEHFAVENHFVDISNPVYCMGLSA